MASAASRRRFLAFSVCAATTVLARPSIVRANTKKRVIALSNVHTGETVETVYWRNGDYLGSGLDRVTRVLRDHRTADAMPIDPRLIDTLYHLHCTVGARRPFCVVSGYRSPATNEDLRKNNRGVAKNSYHMHGKAVDVYLTDVPLNTLRHAALSLRAGGVGYYPKTGFVHLDSGRVRSW